MLKLSSQYFTIFGLNIYYYGIFVALGIAMALFVCSKLAKYRDLKSDNIFVLALFSIPLGVVGARLYYCFYKGIFNISEIISMQGGFAVLGAVIGGTLGAILYCIIFKKNFLKVVDVAVCGLILGQAIGRIGCYFGGCCYGIETTIESLKFFPASVNIGGVWHYSTFFYESILDFIIFIILVLRCKKSKQKGNIFSLYLILYGAIRATLEQIRDPSELLSVNLLGREFRASVLISLCMIVLGLIILITIKCKNHTKKEKNNYIDNNDKKGFMTLEDLDAQKVSNLNLNEIKSNEIIEDANIEKADDGVSASVKSILERIKKRREKEIENKVDEKIEASSNEISVQDTDKPSTKEDDAKANIKNLLEKIKSENSITISETEITNEPSSTPTTANQKISKSEIKKPLLKNKKLFEFINLRFSNRQTRLVLNSTLNQN